jgi:serine/threonine protein kinase
MHLTATLATHALRRPSQLHSRFGAAGADAVDLLARLLEFDPARRASAEEAQQHAYFEPLKAEALEVRRLVMLLPTQFWHAR